MVFSFIGWLTIFTYVAEFRCHTQKGKGSERDAKVTWWGDLSGQLKPSTMPHLFLLSAEYSGEVEITSRTRNILGSNQLVRTLRRMC